MGMVIKASQMGPLRRLSTAYVSRDPAAEAQAVLASARTGAAAMVEDARAEAERQGERIRREARETGYGEGFEEGRRLGVDQGAASSKADHDAEWQRLTAMMSSAVRAFESAKQDLLDRADRDLLRLAGAIAARVTKQVGWADRGVASANAAEALQALGSWSDVTLRAHPLDVAGLEHYAAHLMRELAGGRHVRVIPDESVAPGGCVVESPATRVDATLDGQLQEALKVLFGSAGEAIAEEIKGVESPAGNEG